MNTPKRDKAEEIQELKAQLQTKKTSLECYRALNNKSVNPEWDEVSAKGIVQLSVQIAQIQARIKDIQNG